MGQSLELIRTLCKALDDNQIVYCHWKSNAAIERSATGENDLDLLVGRSSVQKFTELLFSLGFKRAFDDPDRQMPGVLDYYGYDKPSNKFVHVHAHYQLVMGHDATKNYHLPVETAYLETVVQDKLFKVAVPEFELIVLIIRMMIKHATWDVIARGGWRLSVNERQEIQFLLERISRTRLAEILEKHFPWLDLPLLDECMQSLDQQASLWHRARVGAKLQRLLTPYLRRPPVVDVYLKNWRWFVRGVRRKFLHHSLKKHLSNGGLMIAIIGGDGAGKTTAIDNLHKWLAEEFDVKKVHMGKPAWSKTTYLVRGILKVGSLFGLYPFSTLDDERELYTDPPTFPGFPWLIREVCVARDRYFTYVKHRRYASNGGLVICDRFPLPQIKLMDGPQVERLAADRVNHWFVKFLSGIEKRYYKPLLPPDLLIVLRLEPEISVARKTDEKPATVRARASEIWGIDWQQTFAQIVDATKSREAVLEDIKALVWTRL